jgi:hypothetical protein
MSAPSAAQLSYANHLGVEVSPTMSRWEVAKAIEVAKATEVAKESTPAPGPTIGLAPTEAQLAYAKRLGVEVHGKTKEGLALDIEAAKAGPSSRPKGQRASDREAGYFAAMEAYFQRELNLRRRPIREALLRTLAFFDVTEVLAAKYPEGIVEAIKETGWASSPETVWGLMETGEL